jgi:phosphoglycerate dehydrogenase-like enzyme
MGQAASPDQPGRDRGYDAAMSSRWPRVLTHTALEMCAPVTRDFPGIEIVRVPEEGPAPPGASAEILLTTAFGTPNLPDLVKGGVRWIHTIGTGVDRFPFHAVGSAILTCSRGGSAIPIAEWVLAVMLAFEKQLPQAWIHAPPARWNWADLGTLHGKTLALVGLGGIAERVAQLALPFGMRVRAFRRTAAASPVPGIEIVPDLAELLASADHVVVAAALTPATRHLLGRDAFAALKPGAHLVNIARGGLVDQDALRAALDDGRVALASLDVCEPEPLPAGHWLFTHPRVRLTPHTSWSMPGAIALLVETFVENLHHWIRGEPLIRVVDVSQGY